MKLFKIAQNWQNITMDKVTVIPRDVDLIRQIIDSFGGTRFMLGYIKKDGSWRVFHAQRHVSKESATPEGSARMQEIREEYGMIGVYDLDRARESAQDVDRKIRIMEQQGQIIDPETLRLYKDKLLNKCHRSIYPEKIEMIGGRGRVWLVENPINTEVQNLIEQKRREQNIQPAIPGIIPEEVDNQ